MIPIYEQGSGNGIGHSVKTFLAEFEKIAINHVEKGRAKSIAFIFYDFQDRDFKRVLKSEGVFTQLDRLSGKDLSIFYLHSGNDQVLSSFNSVLLAALGAEAARKPCVVFCKATQEGLSDISVANLDSADLIHGFHELYGVIESFLNSQTPEVKAIGWVASGAKFLSLEVVKELIKALIKAGMF
ncbi:MULTISPECIES: hypothetical protein [unclassified Pseudomonas]|uniref:hypothetical protein n=1 Tax=unclassified Pseudomonas TaxID=196821 RepID=UPI0011AED014|nr:MULTISPECIES: hypothetical protein [unclassified Pseudomonas]